MKKLISIIIAGVLLMSTLPCIAGGLMMMGGGVATVSSSWVEQDFSDVSWVETDPNSQLAKTDADTITFTDWTSRSSSDSRVAKDFTSGHFSGNFKHRFVLTISSVTESPLYATWMMSNTLNDYKDILDAAGDEIAIMNYGTNIRLSVVANGSETMDSYTGSTGTYYITVERSGNTINAYIRSISHEGTLLDTLTVTDSEANAYQYLYALNSFNGGADNHMINGTFEHLEIWQ